MADHVSLELYGKITLLRGGTLQLSVRLHEPRSQFYKLHPLPLTLVSYLSLLADPQYHRLRQLAVHLDSKEHQILLNEYNYHRQGLLA